MNDDFSLNPKRDIQLLSIGEEQPVVIIDDLLANPQQLLDYAQQGDEFQSAATDYYPGIRKPISGSYAQVLCRTIQETFQCVFGLRDDSTANVSLCALSLATTEPAQLRPIQSLPHFDTSDSFQLAVVHYLCTPEHGGTSFYRHRQSGYESITSDRVQAYAALLKEQVVSARFPGQQYMNGDSEWFERIASIEAKFNRAIIYRGNLLHSGDINADNGLSHNPLSGRLTANTFINFAPQ